MAINATTLRNLIDTKMASKLDTYASSGSTRTNVKEGLLEAIAEAVAETVEAYVTEEIGAIELPDPGSSGVVPVTDTDIGGEGTSTTSNVVGGGINTNVQLSLGVGTYLIVVQGTYINASGGGPRTQWSAGGGLVYDYFVTQSLISFGNTSSQVSFAFDEGWTAHSGGSTSTMPLTLTTTINVTTAGSLRLRLASLNNGFSTTLSEVVATAFKLT